MVIVEICEVSPQHVNMDEKKILCHFSACEVLGT